MRIFGALGAALAVGAMLAACTKHGSDPGEAGRIAPASIQAPVTDAFAGSTPSSAKPARFAVLPDRGELLRYDAQAPIRDGAYTWHRTELSEQHALDAITSGMLRVATPDGRILGFRYDHSIRHQESGDWTWVGHLAGQEGVQAILTFGEKAVFGSIGQPDARPLRVTVQGGASWLVETDPTQLVGIASHAANPIAPDYHIIPPAALQRLRQLQRTTVGVQAGALAPATASATAASTPTVDLLIGYTQGFVTARGSASAVVTRLNSMVDTANEGLRNSQVNGQIRLVHTMQVNYTDTNTNDAALGQMTGYDTDNQEQTTPNAAFNALRQAREEFGADLVSLVRPFKTPEQDSCGIAWLVGGGKQGDTVAPSNGWDYFGYSVVSDGTDRNETDGKTYYCEEHTLAHELGHNMGSNHDRDNSKGDDNVLDDPDDYGAFAYSFGYKPTSLGKNFYTIMAYGDSGQTPYLTYSNPRITICGGVACGVADSEDNARSLGTMLPIVAQFRATKAPVTNDWDIGGVGDINADGRGDVLWHNPGSQKTDYWLMNGTKPISRGGLRFIQEKYQIAGVADFNGDGRADVLWIDAAHREVWVWLATSSGGFTIQYIRAYPSGWNIAGVGDANADGRADIFWHNATLGRLQTWRMNGAAFSYGPVSKIGNYTVAAIGDFNGDKLADLIWIDNAKTQVWQWQGLSNGTYRSVYIRAYPAGWDIVGAEDVNGDQKADLFWHSRTKQSFQYWLMNGPVLSAYGPAKFVQSKYLVGGVKDFNGDGRADVLWYDATKSELWMWQATTSGGFNILPMQAYPSPI